MIPGNIWYQVNPLPDDKILDSSKLKEFTDDNFKFDENGRKLSKQVKNTVGKEEIARYEQFLRFPQCFQKGCFPGASKGVIVWEWVKPDGACSNHNMKIISNPTFSQTRSIHYHLIRMSCSVVKHVDQPVAHLSCLVVLFLLCLAMVPEGHLSTIKIITGGYTSI